MMKTLMQLVCCLSVVLMFCQTQLKAQFTKKALDIQGVTNSSIALGDYDADGDFDILITGSFFEYNRKFDVCYAKIYRNEAGGFKPVKTAIQGVRSGSGVWGDYDNDGDLDVLITGKTFYGQIAEIYRNDGEDKFTPLNARITGIYEGFAIWGDYDNDADLDVLISGIRDENNKTEAVTKLYANQGNDLFEEVETELPNLGMSAAAWGDMDNDGDLDLVLTGQIGKGRRDKSYVFENDNGQFIDKKARIAGISDGIVQWADFDNDGDIDLLLSGSEKNLISRIYENVEGTFKPMKNNIPGLYMTIALTGDYDNDGDMDVFINGMKNHQKHSPFTRFYKNKQNDFQEDRVFIREHWLGNADWGDYDNDGDLDLFLVGFDGEFAASLYANDCSKSNHLPTIPTKLNKKEDIENQSVCLSWEPASDVETPQQSLTYQIQFGTKKNVYAIKTDSLANAGSPVNSDSVISRVYHRAAADFDTTSYVDSLSAMGWRVLIKPIDANNATAQHPDSFLMIETKPIDARRSPNMPRRAYGRMPKAGSIQKNIYTVRNLTPGEAYFWSVQTVDQALSASPFAPEQGFVFAFKADFTADKYTLCQGETVELNNQSQYADSIHWQLDSTNSLAWRTSDSDNNYQYSSSPIFDKEDQTRFTFNTAGDYNIILTAYSKGFIKTRVRKFTVQPSPVASISTSTDLTACEVKQARLQLESGDGVNFQWRHNDQDIEGATRQYYTAEVSGTYRLLIKNNYGCPAVSNLIDVSIRHLPDRHLHSDKSDHFCIGDTVSIQASREDRLQYQWYKDGEVINGARESVLKTTESGRYHVKLTNSYNCSVTSESKQLIEEALPEPEILLTNPQAVICAQDSLRLMCRQEYGAKYQWYYNGTPAKDATSPVFYAHDPGKYQLQMINRYQCKALSKPTILKVKATAEAIISLNGDSVLCMGDSVELSAKLIRQASYQWYLNNRPIRDANSNSLYVKKTGYYTVAVTNENNCTNYAMPQQIIVNPSPKVRIWAAAGTTICQGDSLRLTSSSQNNWTFHWLKDQKHLPDANQRYYQARETGEYRVEVTNNYGCLAQSNAIAIEVKATPSIKIEKGEQPFICKDKGVKLRVQTNTKDADFRWYKNNYATGQYDSVLQVRQAGDYHCVVISSNRCKNQSQTLSIQKTEIDFGISRERHCGADSIFLNNQSVCPVGQMTYHWDFGDGRTATTKNPTFVYQTAGKFNLSLIVDFDGYCKDSLSQTVQVFPQPTAAFSADSTCFGKESRFKNLSTIAEGQIVRYDWTMGDGQTFTDYRLTDKNYRYKEAGNYIVKLRVVSDHNCISETKQTININPLPEISLQTTGNGIICGQQAVDLQAIASPSQSYYRYQWYQADSLLSITEQNTLSITEPGSYRCDVIAGAGCVSHSQALNIKAANVAFEVESPCLGSETRFLNHSVSPGLPVSYQWDFGNQNTANSTEVTHRYKQTGQYTVSLTANFDDICEVREQKNIHVYVQPEIDFKIEHKPNSLNVDLVCSTMTTEDKIASYKWDFGDEQQVTKPYPTPVNHRYQQKGDYTIKLEVETEHKCKALVNKTISID